MIFSSRDSIARTVQQKPEISLFEFLFEHAVVDVIR